MKKRVLGTIVVCLGMSFSLGAATAVKITAELKNIGVVANNTTHNMNAVVYNGTTYVPVKEFCNIIGTEFEFRDNSLYLDQSNSEKYSYNNPAPLGVSQIGYSRYYAAGKYTAEVQVKEVIRGEKALDILKSNNKHGSFLLKDNQEYLIAKVSARILSMEKDASITFDAGDFIAYSGNNNSYSLAQVYKIPNQLNATLTKNGSTEGYIYITVNKDDKNPKLGLRTDDSNTITDGIWFSLV